MARPRNNIMRLSPEMRGIICKLLDGGMHYDEIRNEPEIAAACAERGLAIHNTTFLAYTNGEEFGEYKKCRRQWQDGMDRTRIAGILVASEQASENIARVADFELLKICLEKLQSGNDLEPKQLAAISRAVAGYNRNLISAKKEDSKREFAEKEAGYQTKIAELSALVQQMTEKLGSIPVDSSNVIAEMDKEVRGE